MKVRNILALALTAVLASVSFSQCLQVQAAPTAEPTARTADRTIVEIAAGNENFTTLVSLVQAAGLAETLSGTGPFTVLAPTNAAFAKVPKEVLDMLAADRDLLRQVLLYHVVPGNVMAADLKAGTVKTAQGEMVTVRLADGKVQFNNATVVTADLKAKNGVIHVIDTVILPPTILEKISGN
ncbi:MAG: fasciclin domain-containing protein [Fimbriimonadaceae bacterium]